MTRAAAPIQHADRPIKRDIRYHVQQVVSCARAGCAHCVDHEASEAYLMRVQREAVAAQNARRAGLSAEEAGW